MKFPQLVQIEWIDSVNEAGWQYDIDDDEFAERRDAMNCLTVGFLVAMDRDSYTISATLGTTGGYLGYHIIPKKAVQRFVRLKLK